MGMQAKKKATRSAAKVRFRLGFVTKALRLLWTPAGKVALALALIVAAAAGAYVNHYYWKYSKVIDDRMAGGAFDRTARLLATPRTVALGDPATAQGIARGLRAAGYTRDRDNQVGWYEVVGDSVRLHPGPLSHFAPEPAQIVVEDGRVKQIIALDGSMPLEAYQIEPELITNLFDSERSKRRLFRYEDYPQHLVDAVIAIEDHRFFDHGGIDFIRTTRAAIDGITGWKKPRGTSTLTQQLARNFFLTREVTYSRKAAEAMIALQLESRFTKEEIFENYSNQIFMGRLGSFNVHGFGEAARGFFDKDVRDVTLAEAALLAGLPQGPSYLNPHRYPERAKARRNLVLAAMLREEMIDRTVHDLAAAEGIALARGHMESRDAPYYVDLVNRSLQKHFPKRELITQDYWVFTTLDKQLQEFAVDAVREGMELVDGLIARQRRFRGKEPPRAEAALVAIDPRTGQVKAVVGGRDYGVSQLNRALAARQPGSVFKPFVYAAAIDTALDREREAMIQRGYGDMLPEYAKVAYEAPLGQLTASTLVLDEPTSFEFSELQPPYEPQNHEEKYFGHVSLRFALIKSLNVAAVKAGQLAGYQRVADLARRAGMGDEVQPYPSLMLGAFEVSPLDVAAAYSAFANKGTRIEPTFLRYVRASQGQTLFKAETEEREAIDTRVAYIVTDMMQDVIRHGSGVRARYTYGITDAAGKTGTDDDGWFAGFTNNLVCVVWVGFDDNTDLGLEGAHSALPIWAMFMKKAHELSTYADPGPFEAPEGVVRLPVDLVHRTMADNYCEGCKHEVYIAGTQPTSADMASYLSARRQASLAAARTETERTRPKRGLLQRVLGAFDRGGNAQAAAPE